MLDTPNSPEAQARPEGDAQASRFLAALEAVQHIPADPALWHRVLGEEMCATIRRRDLHALARYLYAWLLSRLTAKLGVVRDTNGWIADASGLGITTVKKYRKALEAAGLLAVRPCKVEGTNEYEASEIAFPALAKRALEAVLEGRSPDVRPRSPDVQKEGIASTSNNTTIPHHTLPDGSGESGFIASQSLVVLRDWRKSKFFMERGECFTAEPDHAAVDLGEWREMLNRYGGGPAQVATGAALRQAIEIAHEVHAANLTGEILPIRHIAASIACNIARAHAARKNLRSIGFIAERLVRSVSEESDVTPIYDLPVAIGSDAYAQAHEVAATLLDNDKRGAMARGPLMATVEVEAMAGIIAEHEGVHAVYAGWAYACWQNKWPEDGRAYVRWRWLVPAIEAAKTNPKRPKHWGSA